MPARLARAAGTGDAASGSAAITGEVPDESGGDGQVRKAEAAGGDEVDEAALAALGLRAASGQPCADRVIGNVMGAERGDGDRPPAGRNGFHRTRKGHGIIVVGEAEPSTGFEQ